MPSTAGRRTAEAVPAALVAAILATVAAMVIMVLSHPAAPARASAATSATAGAVAEIPLQGARGRTVGDLSADLEEAGADVQTRPLRGNQVVRDDWVVCSALPRTDDARTVTVTARPPQARCG